MQGPGKWSAPGPALALGGPAGSGSALEVLRDDTLYKSTFFTFTLLFSSGTFTEN